VFFSAYGAATLVGLLAFPTCLVVPDFSGV
jgi:hypothetical protein